MLKPFHSKVPIILREKEIPLYILQCELEARAHRLSGKIFSNVCFVGSSTPIKIAEALPREEE